MGIMTRERFKVWVFGITPEHKTAFMLQVIVENWVFYISLFDCKNIFFESDQVSASAICLIELV